MTWVDQISRRVVSAPSGRIACGQLSWQGAGDVQVRQALAHTGDIFLPDGDGRFQCPLLPDIRVDPQTVPDSDALRCLRLLGTGIGNRVGSPLIDWLEEPPLMPPVDETLDETELEQIARAKLTHMEAVCRRPRTHLKLEEERQLVARCQRPAVRAPMVLAARSEDWDRKTLWGIRPKRVLGLVREDLYDLYENRLTVALVDRLDEALTQRVREVRRVVQQARSMEEWQALLASGTNHRRAKRICELWGELWSEEGLLARAERALNRLLQLRRRVLALKDTVLYRQIRGQRRVIHLRMTNVLTHDDVYRGVAELWQAWERHVLMGQEDPQARWAREQEAVRGMQLYGVLLAVRALEVLGFDPIDDDFELGLEPGSKIRLGGPTGPIDFEWRANGELLLSPARTEPVRVCVLPAMLDGSPGSESWVSTLDSVRAIVLFLEADVARAPERVRIRLHGPGPTDLSPVFVPVAPWQLESVERLARALRWRLWTDAMMAYPGTVAYPRRGWQPPGHLPDWLESVAELLNVVLPEPAPLWRELTARIEKAETKRTQLLEQLSVIDPKYTRRTRDKLHLKHALDQLDAELRADRSVQENVVGEASTLANLLNCPVCHSSSGCYHFEQVDGRFRVSCPTCESTWGLRDCQSCGKLFPFLNYPENPPGASTLAADTAYGCDVITLPVDADVYLCLHCGNRSDGAPHAEA